MKKAYTPPKITCEEFAPNEYVAACSVDTSGVKFFVPCRNGGDHAEPHGFLIDQDDYNCINLHPSGYEEKKDKNKQFDVFMCSFEGCIQNVDPNQDRKLGDAVSAAAASNYQWINIAYTGRTADNDGDTALFHTEGTYTSAS